jgi:hypothetical protein
MLIPVTVLRWYLNLIREREKERERELKMRKANTVKNIHTSTHAIYTVPMGCSNARKMHANPNVGRGSNTDPFTSCSQRKGAGEAEMRQNDAKSKPHLISERHF